MDFSAVEQVTSTNLVEEWLAEKQSCSYYPKALYHKQAGGCDILLVFHWYKRLARVTSREARKGFSLKYNPDTHWSAAFYKALNQIHYKDGHNIRNTNRDNATGFQLDTLNTCKQYSNPTVQGRDIVNTRTDFVNKTRLFCKLLRTTSARFLQQWKYVQKQLKHLLYTKIIPHNITQTFIYSKPKMNYSQCFSNQHEKKLTLLI